MGGKGKRKTPDEPPSQPPSANVGSIFACFSRGVVIKTEPGRDAATSRPVSTSADATNPRVANAMSVVAGTAAPSSAVDTVGTVVASPNAAIAMTVVASAGATAPSHASTGTQHDANVNSSVAGGAAAISGNVGSSDESSVTSGSGDMSADEVTRRYTVFNNRVRSKKLPQKVVDRWNELKKFPHKDLRRREFVEELVNLADMKAIEDNPFFKQVITVRSLENVDVEGDQGRWKNYFECCKDHGKLFVDECIRLKSVPFRVSKKLKPGHIVPVPDCYELDWTDDVHSNNTVKKDGVKVTSTESHSEDSETLAMLEDAMRIPQNQQTPVPLVLSAPASSHDGPAPADSTDPVAELRRREHQDAVTEHINKANKATGEWARRSLDFGRTLKKSKLSSNTKDTKPEQELATLVNKGDELAGDLEAHIMSHQMSKDATIKEIKEAGTIGTELFQLVKDAVKKQQGLESFMKI